jgi:hypothetical protein
VLILYYLGGMSNKEIARFLGTSSATIRQRLTRARSQLKEEMLAMMNTSIIASKQGDGDNGSPGPQNTFSMAPGAGEGTCPSQRKAYWDFPDLRGCPSDRRNQPATAYDAN